MPTNNAQTTSRDVDTFLTLGAKVQTGPENVSAPVDTTALCGALAYAGKRNVARWFLTPENVTALQARAARGSLSAGNKATARALAAAIDAGTVMVRGYDATGTNVILTALQTMGAK
jgi:hypothetical protein